MPIEPDEVLMKPGEVAAMFRVDPKTVTRWASEIDPRTNKPRIRSIRTPGGHRRFLRREIEELARFDPRVQAAQQP